MPDIVMPKLSDSMEQGTILSWLKAAGETVEVGDELLEIETDKSTVTYAAEDAGILEILSRRARASRSASRSHGSASRPAEPQPAAANPSREAIAESARDRIAARRGDRRPRAGQRQAANGGGRRSRGDPAGAANRRRARRGARRASRAPARWDGSRAPTCSASAGLPRARQHRCRPRSARGSRRRPRCATAAAATVAARRPAPAASSRARLQQLIARRMAEAKATDPALPGADRGRDGRRDRAARRAEVARRRGRRRCRRSTTSSSRPRRWRCASTRSPTAPTRTTASCSTTQVNVGMAVAADDALVVPTVFDAAGKSLGQIARETRTLAARVRSGEITPAELEGGTFTVSNLGMFGMTAITPVINPPQAAILGVGAMRETLARVDGEIVDRTLLTLTLSCDHRILYGADAARFLARIRELLNQLKPAF